MISIKCESTRFHLIVIDEFLDEAFFLDEWKQLYCCLDNSAAMLVDWVFVDIASELLVDDSVVSMSPTGKLQNLLNDVIAILIAE